MRFNNFWCYRGLLFTRKFLIGLWLSRNNVIANFRGRPPETGPFMAELDVTYRCNLRCKMCQRWQDVRRDEMRIEEYRELAATFDDLGVYQISIAGGEPLLRNDLFEIISSFSRYGMSVNLCTNGMLLHQYAKEICRSGASCVTISLDGATPETHDAIRGTPGSLCRIEKGIQMLLRKPSAKRPVVRVRMTFSGINAHEIRSFYRKWSQIADDVLLQPVHRCHEAHYTGLKDGTYHLDPKVLSEQIDDTPLAKNGYMTELIKSIVDCGSFPKQRCYAGVLMTRIDPWGKVYPCLAQHVCVGSLREQDFKTVWASNRFNEVRRKLASEQPCNCWYNNTALIGHYGGILERTDGRYIHKRIKGLKRSSRHHISF